MKKLLILILCCCMLSACGNKIPYVAEGELGEIITPDEKDKDYSLGEYRYSHYGTKLYFNEDDYPKDLILTFEKYFRSFTENDFETFKSCLYPAYIDNMTAFLEENYSYGLEKSFENQCKSLTGGYNFRITSLRIKKTDGDSEEFIEEFFTSFDETFEKDFYMEVKNNTDKLYHMIFDLMADDEDDEENKEYLLLSKYEIVFAEKDGVYYTFG